jgi:hypothetical protein
MKVEKLNVDRNIVLAVNISGIVGFAGANHKDDVLLIQGLFKYIAEGLHPSAVGLGGEYKIPEITGEMDADTYSAISEFQLVNARTLLMSVFDGRFHPANYANRKLTTGGNKRYMSITYLHFLATDAAVMQSHHSYIQGLAALDPELAYVIDMAIIS